MSVMQYSPKDFMDLYAGIVVTLDSGSLVTVDVHNYKCSNPSFGGTVEEQKYKDKVLDASKHQILKEMTASEFVGVFTGKGKIADIAKCLALCERYGMLDPKKDVAAQLQSICDKYIGLDCNGFVGNWATANGITRFNSQSAPADIASLYRNKRKSLDDIEDFDVLGFPNHIAVVQSVGSLIGKDRLQVTVAESFGKMMCVDRTLSKSAQAGKYSLSGHGSSCVAFDTGLTVFGSAQGCCLPG